MITLHVDDFLVVGEEEHLLELKTALEKVYKLKGKVLGPDEDDSQEGVYLGRRLQWCDWGIEMEGNPKDIQELLKTTGLESCKSDEHAVDSGRLQRRRFQEDRLPAQGLDQWQKRSYPDVVLPCAHTSRKIVVRHQCVLHIIWRQRMATPTQYDWERLKTVCRYLKGCP